jgi:hypothetical protein
MRVKNPNMAGRSMRLRFSGETVAFDELGEAEIPEKDARFLTLTAGWSIVGAKAPRPAAEASKPLPPPPAVPRPATDDEPTVPVKTEATVETEPPPPPEDEDADEAPDLAGMTKRELLEVAEQYDLEVTYEIRRLRNDELRSWIEEQIYEEG